MTPRAIRVTDEIFQVGGYGLTAPEDGAVYLVVFDDRAALIDAGCGRAVDGLLANIGSVGIRPEDIECLLLTHCHFDHSGGAHGIRERLRCPVVAHALDARFVEVGDSRVTAAAWYGASMLACHIDRKLLAAEEEIGLGERTISALHIPGHSPGSVAYVTVSQGQKVLFGQDVHGPLHRSLLSDRAAYRDSLQRLLDLEADILCEGHFGVVSGRDDVAAFIRSYLV
jgi:glyoxylase-like metal-dependent hydrolase (beta-lactamase superfamily II)